MVKFMRNQIENNQEDSASDLLDMLQEQRDAFIGRIGNLDSLDPDQGTEITTIIKGGPWDKDDEAEINKAIRQRVTTLTVAHLLIEIFSV